MKRVATGEPKLEALPQKPLGQALHRVLAGSAKVDITPAAGMHHRMWGAAKHDVSTGVHRPLEAHVVVLQPIDTQDATAYVALDHCMMTPSDFAWVRKLADAEVADSRVQLIFCFSHTHGAGMMDTARADQPVGDLIEPYLREMAGKIGRAAKAARGALRVCWGQTAVGRCCMGANRDQQTADGGSVCGHNPEGEVDDRVVVGRWTDEDGTLVATLVNYACHPTTLAWQNTLISPDYVGAMREVVRSRHDAPCIFLQGASGDVGPRVGFVGDVEQADRNGRELGYAALSALESLDPPGTTYTYRGAPTQPDPAHAPFFVATSLAHPLTVRPPGSPFCSHCSSHLAGPMVSGATIGVWEHAPIRDAGAASADACASAELARFDVALRYKQGLGTIASVEADMKRWQQSDDADARAMEERCRRWLRRLRGLPPGDTFPFPVSLLRVGSMVQR
jgi:hypothetical protein